MIEALIIAGLAVGIIAGSFVVVVLAVVFLILAMATAEKIIRWIGVD